MISQGLNSLRKKMRRLNPLKRVNSILTTTVRDCHYGPWQVSIPSSGSIQFLRTKKKRREGGKKSQSPQAGQFNSYKMYFKERIEDYETQSPQAVQFNNYKIIIEAIKSEWKSLNPLKRVNSILTGFVSVYQDGRFSESQSPQAGQFNSYLLILRLQKNL